MAFLCSVADHAATMQPEEAKNRFGTLPATECLRVSLAEREQEITGAGVSASKLIHVRASNCSQAHGTMLSAAQFCSRRCRCFVGGVCFGFL